MNGTVFELKRFAVHDGPGIRSTLFLKGCPLHCPWCQNPEGMQRPIRLWHTPSTCIHCGSCVSACPKGALCLTDRVHIRHEACTLCGKCISACPTGSFRFDGWTVSSQEAAHLLLRDKVFFENGGGITLSGGEVFSQWAFALDVLKTCKAAGADTAIESCMYVDTEILAQFVPFVDHFLMDLKYADPQVHEKVLGVSNARILKNHAYLLSVGADVLVRTPLIPGYTATQDNIRAIARYLAAADPGAKYELLNFNPLCRSKYSALEQDYPVQGQALSGEQMELYYAILREEGIHTIVKE